MRTDSGTTSRQEADLYGRAMRARPKGHVRDARDQLRSEGPGDNAASHKTRKRFGRQRRPLG